MSAVHETKDASGRHRAEEGKAREREERCLYMAFGAERMLPATAWLAFALADACRSAHSFVWDRARASFSSSPSSPSSQHHPLSSL